MSAITYGTAYALPTPRPHVSAHPRLRLTRRGRAVIAALVALPLVLAFVLLALNEGGATATSGAEAPVTVTVQAGESLWSLAGSLAPAANPADVVADILAINSLDSASVQPGQILIVPARYAD